MDFCATECETSGIRVESFRSGTLRATKWSRRISLFRIVRSAKSAAHWRIDGGCGRETHHSYTTDQAIPRGEILVRAILAATATRILATRTGREIFQQIAGGHSLHLAARSDTVAA